MSLEDLNSKDAAAVFDSKVQELYRAQAEIVEKRYSEAQQAVQTYLDGKDKGETGMALEELEQSARDAVISLNADAGTQWTFQDFIAYILGDQSKIDAALHQAEDSVNTLTGLTADAEAAQSQIRKFYENAKSSQEKTKIKARSDAGWKDEQQGWIDT